MAHNNVPGCGAWCNFEQVTLRVIRLEKDDVARADTSRIVLYGAAGLIASVIRCVAPAISGREGIAPPVILDAMREQPPEASVGDRAAAAAAAASTTSLTLKESEDAELYNRHDCKQTKKVLDSFSTDIGTQVCIIAGSIAAAHGVDAQTCTT